MARSEVLATFMSRGQRILRCCECCSLGCCASRVPSAIATSLISRAQSGPDLAFLATVGSRLRVTASWYRYVADIQFIDSGTLDASPA